MFIWLDVSKLFHVASTVDGKASLTFNHDATGFLELKIWVEKLAGGSTPIFGLELTGRYSFLMTLKQPTLVFALSHGFYKAIFLFKERCCAK